MFDKSALCSLFGIPNKATPLERYGHNLTLLARQGAFAPLDCQEGVRDRVFQVLQRTSKCNPVILDGDEVGRRTVVAEVIRLNLSLMKSSYV